MLFHVIAYDDDAAADDDVEDDDDDDDDDDEDDDNHEANLRNTSCTWDCCYGPLSPAEPFVVEQCTSANSNSYDYHAPCYNHHWCLYTFYCKYTLYHWHSSRKSLPLRQVPCSLDV